MTTLNITNEFPAYANLKYEGTKLFKHFEINFCKDSDKIWLHYQTCLQRKVKKLWANRKSDVIFYVESKIVKSLLATIAARKNFNDRQLKEYDDIKVGDIVCWIVGYGCTLYQFAKVIKKHNKKITYQKYGYRGMDDTTHLWQNGLINEFETLNYKKAHYNLYNPDHDKKHYYDNNSD